MPDDMVKYAIPKPHARALTVGEVRLAASIFGAALDTRKVSIHNHPYIPGQAKGVAMTPNGDVYFTPTDFKADFSVTVGDAAWLVHELTHSWQYQTGRSTRMRGLLEQFGRLYGNDPYPYGTLDPAVPFSAYKNEQQAAIVEDYYRIMHKLPPRFGTGALAHYKQAIPFVRK